MATLHIIIGNIGKPDAAMKEVTRDPTKKALIPRNSLKVSNLT